MGQGWPVSATYLDLADDLQDELRSAGADERVVSEHELAVAHGISRPTARAALQELERRYVVRRVRGAGTFVNQRIDYTISAGLAPSYSATVRRAGGSPGSQVVEVRARRGRRQDTDALGLPSGARVVALTRVMAIDGEPVGVISSCFPVGTVPGLVEAVGGGDGPSSLDELLRSRYGLRPQRRWSRASLEIPTTITARQIGLDGSAPSWRIESANADGKHGPLIEHSVGWHRADVLRVIFELGVTP